MTHMKANALGIITQSQAGRAQAGSQGQFKMKALKSKCEEIIWLEKASATIEMKAEMSADKELC